MERIKRVKYFFFGMIIMAIICTMVFPALAVSTNKQITAYFNNIKLFVDDNLIQPTDSTGKIVEPFVYNGTTYLPVRAVANALDKAVIWDGKTSSVYIGKHNTDIPAANLNDMDYFYVSLSSSVLGTMWDKIGPQGIIDNTGMLYNIGATLDCTKGSSTRIYLINQKYSHFKGKIAVVTKDNSDGSGIKIYGDDTLLYSSPIMTAGSYPTDFDVDVSGVIQLKIEWYGTDYGSPLLVFSGLNFYS